MRKTISRILIIIGILLLLGAGGLTGYNLWDAHRADVAAQSVETRLEEMLEEAGQTANGTSTADPADTPIYEEYPDMEMPTKTIDGYRYVGILEVPALNLKLPVMEEWDYTRLKISPCRYSGSVYMNNMVIAGHNYRRHFSPLKWQDVGTKVNFTDMAGNVFHYELSWTEVIDPDKVEDMTDKDVDKWDLTLFTCTTGGTARYAMRCTLIEEEENE